jgi:arylsulfatase A-like enzyme
MLPIAPCHLWRALIRWSGLALAMVCMAQGVCADRPNVVILVIDDLGWGDLSCNGGEAVKTPHLDALLRRGKAFTNGYVAAPICGPSRSAILTGRSPARLGLTANHQPLPLGERTIAELLRSGGYATAAFGKWHQGGDDAAKPDAYHPTRRGFDVFDGLLGHSGRTEPAGVAGDIDRCLGFLAKNAGRPCFVYAGLGPVHTPLAKDPTYLAAVKGDDISATRRQYLACLLGLDDAIGRFVDGMDHANAWRNTLVWVINDNGGKTAIGSSNLPWRGGKYSLFEGGIHVPFAVISEGRLERSVCEGLVSSMDILPTTLQAVGLAVPPDLRLDGTGLWPQLTGREKPDPQRMLFWRGFDDCEPRCDGGAARMGRWKLIRQGGGGGSGGAKPGDQLYDLAADPGESSDCAAKHPEVVAALNAGLDRFLREAGSTPSRK